MPGRGGAAGLPPRARRRGRRGQPGLAGPRGQRRRCAGWRSSTCSSTTPTARAGTCWRWPTGTATASTTASASTPSTSSAPCCGAGPASRSAGGPGRRSRRSRRGWSEDDALRRRRSASCSPTTRSRRCARRCRRLLSDGPDADAVRGLAVDPVAGVLSRFTGPVEAGRRLRAMRAWRDVAVPSLRRFGPAPAVRIHDTATGGAASPPSPPSTARLYVCGITPYDATHLGHAATYLAFDLLNRAWRDAGHEVRYVQNVTDVDDPLLERADRDGEDWRELADREIERFRGDMRGAAGPAARRVRRRGRVDPAGRRDGRSSSTELGHAYEVDGDWYFSVHADPRVRRGLGPHRGGDARGSSPSAAATPTGRARSTRSTACCGAPSGPASRPGTHPSGRGRPGWHIECSAIALTTWASASTSRAAAATWSSRTTR